MVIFNEFRVVSSARIVCIRETTAPNVTRVLRFPNLRRKTKTQTSNATLNDCYSIPIISLSRRISKGNEKTPDYFEN